MEFDPAGDLAVGEAGEDELTGLDLVGRADEGEVFGVESQAVAAGEDGEGAEGLEPGGEAGQAEAAIGVELAEGLAGAVGQAVEAVAGVVEVGLSGGAEPVGQAVEVQRDLAAIGDADLAGLAGSQGAVVGGQVGEGHVDLVADRRDDRDRGMRRWPAPRSPR